MPVILLLVVVCVLIALVESGVLPSPTARIHVGIRQGRIVSRRGVLPSRSRELLADLVRTQQLRTGFITVSGRSRVRFSRHIPHGLRQQLRNVILL